jgi:hypothetical protein
MFISEEYNMEIQPDELAQFIMDYESGKDGFAEYAELIELKQAFKDVTGFRWEWNPKFFRNYISSSGQDTKNGEEMPF